MLYLLWSLKELTRKQLIEAERNIVLVKQRVWRFIVLGERFLIISVYPNGAEIVFDLAVVVKRLSCSVTPGASFTKMSCA